jgi:hypothetical protein
MVKDSYWFKTQLWAAKNTAKDAKFIIPFSDDSLSGMQIYAKRSAICLKAYELHLVAFLDPELTIAAVKEFSSFWNVPKENGIPVNFSEYSLLKYSKLAGSNLNHDNLLLLKKKFDKLSYIITDGRDIMGLSMVYMNKYYKIFEIK